jgi:hypothetical protein
VSPSFVIQDDGSKALPFSGIHHPVSNDNEHCSLVLFLPHKPFILIYYRLTNLSPSLKLLLPTDEKFPTRTWRSGCCASILTSNSSQNKKMSYVVFDCMLNMNIQILCYIVENMK